jgi:hypothetical protein
MCVGDYSKYGMNRAAVTLKLIILFIENPMTYQDLNTDYFDSFDDLRSPCDFWHINHMTTSGRNATVLCSTY